MSGNYVSFTLFLCFAVALLHVSDAWFLKRASLRRYYGGRPRIIYGEPIAMPAPDETMMRYVKTTAEQKIKEYNIKQKLKGEDDLYDLYSGPDSNAEGSSSDSITIGLPMPFIRSKNKQPTIPESDYTYSTINSKYKGDQDLNYESTKDLPSITTLPVSSPDVLKMIKIDFTGGKPKDSKSVLNFFKMPTEESAEKEVKVINSDKKGPTAFVIQWNLPMVFRKYK